MTSTFTFSITPRGAFSLRESATFGFGQRDDPSFEEGVMRMAFRLDGSYETPVGVEVSQDGDHVLVTVHGTDRADDVRSQVARILSLEHDATDYDELAEHDSVIRVLMESAPGLRPPLFHSPYEAAAWSVLSARRPRHQMAEVRHNLSLAYGDSFSLAGQRVSAFPAPSALVGLQRFPGLEEEKVARLRGVAELALVGGLEAEHLQDVGPEEASALLQQIRGIGPTYASLIVIRACGFTDVLPSSESQLWDCVGELWGLGAPATARELAELSQIWRPWRTWVSVLIRAASGRVLVCA